MEHPTHSHSEIYFQALGAREIVRNAAHFYWANLALLVIISLFPHLVLLVFESLLLSTSTPSGNLIFAFFLATVVMNGIALSAVTIAVTHSVLGAGRAGPLRVYRIAFGSNLPAVILIYFFTAMMVSMGMMPGVFIAVKK